VRFPTLLSLPLVALFGCPSAPVGDGSDDDDDATAANDDDATPCEYPADPAEEMAVGSVLWPFNWPTAIAPDGGDRPLSLTDAHCNEGPDDWSPFDVLLFVSIPAW
jgi:hypothetical protein